MVDRQLLAVIGDIYDAALDPTLWPRTLDRTASFVGGSGASIFSHDVVQRTGHLHHQAGAEPHYATLYFNEYIKLDPMNAAYRVFNVGEVFSSSTFLPHAEFAKTPFYKEWVKPQGWVDSVSVVLHRSGNSQATAIVFRDEHEGLADEAARDRMRLLTPHLRRAMQIGKMIDLKTAEAATLVEALDGITAGIFLVDARGRIVHANAAGHCVLAAGKVMRAVGNRLAPTDMQADRALGDILRSAEDGDAGMGSTPIALPLAAWGAERHIAHILPLTSGARRSAGANHGAVAAVFLHKAGIGTACPPEAIAKCYGLTPTEARVLLAIVEVGGVPAVAQSLGVADTTVKTHLGRLYGKTGTARQADLVKLVAGFSHPLLN